MTATYADDTATFTITLPGNAPQEPECTAEDCPRVAIWRCFMERPCPHDPKDHCQIHYEYMTTGPAHAEAMATGGWFCRECISRVGFVERWERIPR